ncbi:hypothetical protein LTR95_004872, partial [Oleoguttula sp. CCFEE 5521]
VTTSAARTGRFTTHSLHNDKMQTLSSATSTAAMQPLTESLAAFSRISDSDDLAARVLSLMVELYDLIRSLTLDPVSAATSSRYHEVTLSESQVITIDRTWRPPSIIQGDSASRSIGAKYYYGTNIFRFDSHEYNDSTCVLWLIRFSPLHMAYVNNMRLQFIDEPEWLRRKPVDCSELFTAGCTIAGVEMPKSAYRIHSDEVVVGFNVELDRLSNPLARVCDEFSRGNFAWAKKLSDVMHVKLQFTACMGDSKIFDVWVPAKKTSEVARLEAIRKEIRWQQAAVKPS